MRVFVTGGTGLLGNTVIRRLLQKSCDVRALVRSDPGDEVFEGLDVELVQGELAEPKDEAANPVHDSVSLASEASDSSDKGSRASGSSDDAVGWQAVADAIQWCDVVVHAAAMIHLGWTRVEESLRVNRDGTAGIVDECLRHNKKLVFVGTVNALAVGSRSTIADEATPLDHAGGQVDCAYVKSKRAALEVVRQACSKGLNAVVMHPGFMLGPWDWKPSSGRMMLEVGTGWKPVAPSGGCSLCDSRDVADAISIAVERDLQSGTEYILAGHNWSYLKLWSEMAVRMGKRPPIRAAGPGMEFLAGTFGDLWTRFRGSEPDVNSAGVRMSGQYHWYSSRRAQTDLEYQIRDAVETLDDAAEWIKGRFILPRDDSTR